MGVTQKFTGDSTQLVREYEKILAQQAKLEQRLEKSTEAQKRRATQELGFNQRVATSLVSVAAGYISIERGISVIAGAVEDYNKQLKESAELSKDMAKAHANAIKNMAGMSTVQKTGMIESASDIALRTGFPDVGELVEAMGAGISAGGSKEAVLSAVEAAAMVTQNNPEQLSTYVAGAIDIGRGSRVTDARKNLGFIMQAGAQARVTDPEMLAKNLAPVVASAASRVAPEEKEEVSREAAAIFATLSRAATDERGMATTTAATQFMGRMNSFYKDMENAPSTPFEQLRLIQTDERVKASFFKESFGEERYKAAFQEIATAGSSMANEVLAAKDAITFGTEEFDNQAREGRTATGELFVASADSNLDAVNKQLKADLGRAFAETLRENVKENLSLTRGPAGLNYIGRFMGETGAGLPIVSAKSPEEALQAARDTLSWRLGGLQIQRAYWDKGNPDSVPTTDEVGVAAMIKKLDELHETLKEQKFSSQALQKYLESRPTGPVNARAQTRTQEGLGGVDQ